MNELTKKIEEAFSSWDPHFLFDCNKELIDVNNCFRLISYNAKKYVVKKHTLDKAANERKNAEQAYKRLMGHSFIAGVEIIVVVPEIIKCHDKAYLVSEYLGETIQSQLYRGEKCNLSVDQLVTIERHFLALGILNRGFLPRNIIVKGQKLYLIDWEDTVFSTAEKIRLNRLCETNFVLNWMYCFDRQILWREFQELQDVSLWHEPDLLSYEKLLTDFLDWDRNDLSKVRNRIEHFVFNAEQPCKLNESLFPNDMAHLISDIFSVEIDVFFDSLAFVLRKEHEYEYSLFISILEKYIRENQAQIEKIQKNILSFLLLMTETERPVCSETDVLALLSESASSEHPPCWMTALENQQTGAFRKQIKTIVENIRLQIHNTYLSKSVRAIDLIVDKICSIMLDDVSAFQGTREILFKYRSCEVFRNLEERVIPGSWHILSRLPSDEISEANVAFQFCTLIKTIRHYLYQKGVRITGIYMESDALDILQAWILPFHVSVLDQMGIQTELYQPHIQRYLESFPEDFAHRALAELFDEELCDVLQDLDERQIQTDVPAYNMSSVKKSNQKHTVSPLEVDSISDLPAAPDGFKYFSCIGGNKNFQCFLEKNTLSRGKFLELYEEKLDPCLRLIRYKAHVNIRQDAMYAIPGFMIISPVVDYRNLESLPLMLFYECFLTALKIRKLVYDFPETDRVYIYYDEHDWKPSTAHFWVLPVSKGNGIPQIKDQSIWSYMDTFCFQQQREEIYKYLEKIEQELYHEQK